MGDGATSWKWLTPSRAVLGGVFVVAAASIWLLPTLGSTRSFTNVMAIIQSALVALGLYSLYFVAEQARLTAEQVSQTREQTQQTAKWNKLLSYHQFFGELITTEMVLEMMAVAERCGFKDAMNSVQAMSLASRQALENDPVAVKTVAAYLDEFEEFCAAVQAGVTASEYAYTLEATRVLRAWIVFEPFIQSQRATHRFSRCYLELERIGSAWKERRERETQQKYAQDGVQQHV